MKNVEFIKCENIQNCYKCDGTGFGNLKETECSICEGTGKFDKSGFILVATQPNGQKIAFGVDQAGK